MIALEDNFSAEVRKQFEAYYTPYFDLTKKYNEWGRVYVYVHPHIESRWEGWRDNARKSFDELKLVEANRALDIQIDEASRALDIHMNEYDASLEAGARLTTAQEDGYN